MIPRKAESGAKTIAVFVDRRCLYIEDIAYLSCVNSRSDQRRKTQLTFGKSGEGSFEFTYEAHTLPLVNLQEALFSTLKKLSFLAVNQPGISPQKI